MAHVPAAVAAAAEEEEATAEHKDSGNAERLVLHERLAGDFAAQGLDVEGVKAVRSSFDATASSSDSSPIQDMSIITPTPHPSRSFSPALYALPYPSVRLIVLPWGVPDVGRSMNGVNGWDERYGGYDRSARRLTGLAREFASQVSDVLCREGVAHYCLPEHKYHCTVFHASHPTGVNWIGDRESAAVQAEIDTVRDIRWAYRQSRPLVLEVERVSLARSGVLLVLFTDRSEDACGVVDMRRRCWTAFPDAPKKQVGSNPLIHSSLLRVLDGPLSPSATSTLLSLCARWTSQLRGERLVVTHLWHILEVSFSALEGETFQYGLGKGEGVWHVTDRTPES
eukprot:jgi/Chlat1/2438/Chrsp17S02684